MFLWDAGRRNRNIAVAGLGCRRLASYSPEQEITDCGEASNLARPVHKLFKRCKVVGWVIGHLKPDHRMEGNHMRGEIDGQW